MLVADVMTTDLVTCDAEATLRTAAGHMYRERVGSVVVYRDGDPTGIVTEADLIRAAYRTGTSFEEIPVESAMSHPLVTIPADRTLRRTTERMQEAGVKKLPVVDGLDVVGVVTMTDVVDHYSDVKREIHEQERRSLQELG